MGKPHITCNLAEMAAYEMIAGIEPDRYLLVLDPEGDTRKDKAWGVYDDPDELPKHIEIKKFLEFAGVMNRRKLDCFSALRKERLEEEEQDGKPKQEKPKDGTETK